MRHATFLLAASTAIALPTATALADGWVTFVNQTASRVVAPPAISTTDPDEKDFAYADLDKDGDIDLIVVRKVPVTTPTGRRNVLLMNEGGVLVDRSVEFATLADDGGQGFLDITNDRDVFIVDVNNDGWLDFVTCTALNQGMPKTISHPRIYMNQKNDPNGAWKGFKYEVNRFPTLPTAPNGCAISAGDVTGDGFVDLYMVTYNSTQGDRLLINDGTGFFTDQTLSRMTPAMIASGFGTSSALVDMNGDGLLDGVKSENGPFKVTYNNPAQIGHFNAQETASSGSHYNMSVGDLNNDGKMDAVVSDDGSDRYLLNLGNGADGMANFESKTYSFQNGGDDGIAGNSRIVDINNDGFKDVVIADFDVDISGCVRRTHFYRNLGNVPSVTLQDQGTCGIPAAQLVGTYDIAVFDLDGDGWKDIILGRCAGISVWMNQPPIGLVVSYPNGLPAFVAPDDPTVVVANLSTIGSSTIVDGSPALHYILPGGGKPQTSPLLPDGKGNYVGTLPAVTCAQDISWWVSANLNPGGGVFSDPPNAPESSYQAMSALGTKITSREEFEGVVTGWTVVNDPSLTGGGWEVADPNGTAVAGKVASPEDDATSGDGVKCFTTQNGVPGGPATATDVDGGPTFLLSPTINLEGTDAFVSFAAWFFCDNKDNPTAADSLFVEISNDNGQVWNPVMTIATSESAWNAQFVRVSDFVVPTSTVRFRFWTKDAPNNSVTEAGIDNFQIETVLCSSSCNADLTGNSTVDGADLAVLLGAWGTKGEPGFPGDLTNDGTIDAADLGALLGAWGDC